MKDAQLQKLINATLQAGEQYFNLLIELELEYEKRYEFLPSEIDDDFFIDTFHQLTNKNCTVKELKENAKFYKKLINK